MVWKLQMELGKTESTERAKKFTTMQKVWLWISVQVTYYTHTQTHVNRLYTYSWHVSFDIRSLYLVGFFFVLFVFVLLNEWEIACLSDRAKLRSWHRCCPIIKRIRGPFRPLTFPYNLKANNKLYTAQITL